MTQVKLDTLELDSKAQPRTEIDWVLVSEYAEAMGNGARFPPIIVYCNGKNWLADGFHRVSAARQAGLSELDADIRQGGLRDAILYSVGANAENGKRRTNEDKRRAVTTLLQDGEWGKWSDREIARQCAVSPAFVDNIRASLPTIGSDESRIYTTKHGTVATMHTENIGASRSVAYVLENNGIKRCTKDPLHIWIADIEYCPYCNISPQARIDYSRRMESGARQPVKVTMFSHESVEYYTPKQYLDAAREVMGEITLDPASCDEAQKTVKAKQYYTEADDGLKQKWSGHVWLNPPYSKTEGESNQGLWSKRLIDEYNAGNVIEAILLVKAALGYKWFEEVWDVAPSVCFARDRLSFVIVKESGASDEGQSKQGTALFYFGKDVPKFVDVFRRFGRVLANGRVYQCRVS